MAIERVGGTQARSQRCGFARLRSQSKCKPFFVGPYIIYGRVSDAVFAGGLHLLNQRRSSGVTYSSMIRTGITQSRGSL